MAKLPVKTTKAVVPMIYAYELLKNAEKSRSELISLILYPR